MKKIENSVKNIIYFWLVNFIIFIVFGTITYKFGINIIMIFLSILFFVFNYLHSYKKEKFEIVINKMVKYRYIIYLIIFLICLIFKISGSSIGYYNDVFSEKIINKNSTLFGKYQSVRSDEFVVLTPYYLSQVNNNFNKYSNYMSIDGQNMIIGYNSPVFDITTLAKPLNWGFILLGKDYGLSWYWCMKLILIFAFSFEFMYILTKKNKILSILGAFMITWGPSTQWWFAPHMPDVILWSMGLFSGVYYFFKAKNTWLKNLLTVGVPLLLTEFVIALFPSFQVGLGYFIFFIFLCLIYRDKIKLFKDKNQNIRIIIAIILSILLIGYFILTNIDALKLSINTVYPGSRSEIGGNYNLSDLFTDLMTLFLSYKTSVPYSNPSELSTYIHFGVFFLLLSPSIIFKLKKSNDRDWIIGVCFNFIMIIYIIFMLFGFPKILSKITLFSYINRMKMIFGIISVFYTIWSINALFKLKEKINLFYYIICILIYCIINFTFINPSLLRYLPKYIYYLEILAYGIILMLLYFDTKKLALSGILGLVLFASIPINPIITGTSDIYNHPSAKKISKIVKKDKDAYWLGYNNILYPSYLIANGAKTINAVNYYPDFKKWKIFDPNKKYENVYNRYAHIITKFSTNGKNKLEKLTDDSILISLNIETVIKLKVKYIFSGEKLKINNEKYYLKKLYQDSNCYIYEILKK